MGLQVRKSPSVIVALLIGSIEILQVLIRTLDLEGGFYDFIAGLDFGVLGYIIVGMFLLAWGASVAYWKFGRIEQRYGKHFGVHSHVHSHDGGAEHAHRHMHFPGRTPAEHAAAHGSDRPAAPGRRSSTAAPTTTFPDE